MPATTANNSAPNAFEQKLMNTDKSIAKRDAKLEARFKFYKSAIARQRMQYDRVFIANVIQKRTGQERIVTWADMEEKKSNATKKLAKQIRDQYLVAKFGSTKPAECVAREMEMHEAMSGVPMCVQ